MIKKAILFGPEAREKLLRGAQVIGKFVGSTLGPGGRNSIIQTPYSAPSVTNDGVTIARSIALDDEIEDLGAQTVVEASMKTNDRAGDGTTTTVVIATQLIEDCAKVIKVKDEVAQDIGISGADVMGMARDINIAKDIVLEKLQKRKKDIKKGDIKNIIATSIGKMYPQFVDPIAEMIEKVGKDGYIAVEDNWFTKFGVETQLVEGMRFLGSYATPFAVNTRKKEAVWEDTPILVCNYRLEALTPIAGLIKQVLAKGYRKIVIVAEGFSGPLVKTFANTIMTIRETGDTRLIEYLPVKAPSLTTEQFEDVAAFCNAKFFNKNLTDNDLMNASIEHLGFAKKVVVDEDETIISGTTGNVKERLEILQNHLVVERDPAFAEQIKRRIGALTSGFGIIRVGAATEPDRKYIKYKIEDAINAGKAALEEGVVQGGGLVLKEIAEELGDKNILYGALKAPYEKIQANAGGSIDIPKTVIDPVKVTRMAVENACSVAAQLITSESAISNKRKSLWDELDKKISPLLGEDSDFRSDENQEQRFRS